MSAAFAGVILAIALASCAPYNAIVPTPPQIIGGIAPGSIVRLSVKGGETLKDLRVIALDSEKVSVCARGRRHKEYRRTIPISQIETIETRSDVIPQTADITKAIMVENVKSHKIELLGVGHTVYFRTHGTTRLAKGWISSVTDSAISFYTRVDRRTINLTVSLSDLKMLVIPSQGVIDFGSVAIVTGSSAVAYGLLVNSIEALPFTPSGTFDSTNRNIPLKGLGFIGFGTILKVFKLGKRMDLTGQWTISTRVIPSRALPKLRFSDAIPLGL